MFYDPTKDEMIKLVKEIYPEADEFDIEEAIYWFASDYHSGQWTNLYSVLSTSQFRPGMTSSGVSEISFANEIYELFVLQVSS